MSASPADEDLDDGDVEQFTRLFAAHLARATSELPQNEGREDAVIDPTAELEAFKSRIPLARRQALDRLAERLRHEFHADQQARRRADLYALLCQMPPFDLGSDADQRRLRSSHARRSRSGHLRDFVGRFVGSRSSASVGVRPFFAALRRLLEAQSNDRAGRTLQWFLDDAVLMESGGPAFMRQAVWMLKGVLHMSERRPADGTNPFATPADGAGHDDVEFLRIWTMPVFLSNQECASLARLIPSHVLPSRGRGSEPVHADGALCSMARDDEERQSAAPPIALPTGSVRYAPFDAPRRDPTYHGTWLEWLLGYFYSVIPFL